MELDWMGRWMDRMAVKYDVVSREWKDGKWERCGLILNDWPLI